MELCSLALPWPQRPDCITLCPEVPTLLLEPEALARLTVACRVLLQHLLCHLHVALWIACKTPWYNAYPPCLAKLGP
jgi:hypothetical protein